MNKELFDRQSKKIINHVFSDEAFKQRLIADPKGVFKEYDIDFPEDTDVKVIENTDRVFHFVLPIKTEDEVIHKHWFGEAFEDLWKFTFGDGKHEKTWDDVREEDKKIFHEVG